MPDPSKSEKNEPLGLSPVDAPDGGAAPDDAGEPVGNGTAEGGAAPGDAAAAEGGAAPEDAPAPDDADATVAGRTARLDDRAEQPTERRPAVGEQASDPNEEPPRLRDVTGTAGSYLRGRLEALGSLVGTHRGATVILALMAVCLVAGMIVAGTSSASLPTHDAVVSDAWSLVSAPTYRSGSFGQDDVLAAREVEVRSVERVEGADGGERAEAVVLVTYEGEAVSAEKLATIDYVRSGDSWSAEGGTRDERVSWRTGTGVDDEKVVRNIGVVLARADRELGSDEGGLSLADLYDGAEVTVDRSAFDAEAQTSTLDLTCTRAGSFESYVCQLAVTFGFRQTSGEWEIEDVSVGEGAFSRSLEPIVGTWEGVFSAQTTDGTKCLAAREAGLVVTVDDAAASSGTVITGTVSCVAHYHEHPGDDAPSCAGDLELVDVPFTATLVDGHDDATDSDLAFVATLPEDVDGTTTLTLGFGTADDPARAVAVVETSYQHTGSFLFFPYDETITYADTFALSHAE